MTTRTQKLSAKFNEIYTKYKKEIDALPRRGPRGGTNAAHITGWVAIGNGTITKAANQSKMPTLNYWSGSHPTPSSAIPYVAHVDMMHAYNAIFPYVGK